MTAKFSFALIALTVLMSHAGRSRPVLRRTLGDMSYYRFTGTGHQASHSLSPEPEGFMKQRTNKLSPLLGPGFPHQSAESVQPSELFPVWRKLPQFSNWDDLTLACMIGDIQKAQDLLTHGADPSGQPSLGTSPLIEALSHNHPDVATLLLDKASDASRQTPAGWTALHLAVSNGLTDLARRILSRSVDIDSTTQEGWTPLILAAKRRHPDIVNLLLDHGADPEIQDAQGATALLYATTGGQEESGGDADCVDALIEHGANVNTADAHGWTPLMGAAFYGDIRSVQLLVEAGARIDATNKKGETARSLAESNKQLRVSQFLSEPNKS